jgi:outer membrane lipoprotein-sorting protein
MLVFMKKLSLSNVLLVGLVSSLACAPSTDSILAKMVEAQGGRAALEKISDRTISGTMQMAQAGASGPVRMYQKMPNMMRMEFEVGIMTLVQTYDGVTAWETNHITGQTRELPEDVAQSFERQALGPKLILNPEEWGVEYAYLGKERVWDKDCHVLEQSFSDGFKSTLYVDAESYLLIMVEATDVSSAGAEVATRTVYSNYQEVEGVMIPYKISGFQGKQETMLMMVTDVVFNSELPDSLFVLDR